MMAFRATDLIWLLIHESPKSNLHVRSKDSLRAKFHFSVNAKNRWAEEIMNDFLNLKDCTPVMVVVAEMIAHGSERP